MTANRRLRPALMGVAAGFAAWACTHESPSDEGGAAPDGGAGGSDVACDDEEPFADPADPERTLVALRRSEAIEVDGNFVDTDFEAAPAASLSDPEGESDNEMRVRAAWDPLHLYLAAEVEDADLESDGDVSTHQNDGIEVFVDTNRGRDEEMRRSDYQWIIPIEGSPVARRGRVEGGTEERAVVALDHAAWRGDGGYRVELRIAWEDIGVDPSEDDRLGLLLANNDRDGDEHVGYAWGGLFPFKTPAEWGDLRLAGVRCGADEAPVDGAGDEDDDDDAGDCPVPPEGEYGADANDTCDPIGGGEGYRRIVTEGDVSVETRAELVGALESAEAGDVVYVEGDAEIELQGSDTLTLPGGVTLASNRGHEGAEGGLLYSEDRDTPQLMEAAGDGARITGLRIRGPYTGTDRIDDHSRGISASSNDIEIDNCEIWGFTHYATSLSSGHVHHNDIHHNRRGGLGYGVLVGGGPGPLIEANRFDENRHSIAAPGCASCKYEARFNHVDPNRNGHAFDLHETRCETDDDGEYLSGEQVLIHHNTFLGNEDQPIGIRGNPRSPSEVHHNWFEQRERPITQKNGTKRLESYDNQVGAEREVVEGPPVYHWTGSVGACE